MERQTQQTEYDGSAAKQLTIIIGAMCGAVLLTIIYDLTIREWLWKLNLAEEGVAGVISAVALVGLAAAIAVRHYYQMHNRLAGEIALRDRTETRLKEASQYYLTILENFPVLIWRVDSQGHGDYFNDTWLDFTGRSLKQELGRRWIEDIHPEDRKDVVSVRRRSLDDRESFETTYRLRRYDGEYRWIVDTGRPFFHQDGSFAGFIGACYDVTDRKLAEESLNKLLARSQQLESIINLSPAVAFQWYPEEGMPVAFVSDNVEQFGYNHEDFTSGRLRYSDIIYHEDLHRILEEVRDYGRQRTDRYVQEYRIISKSGQLRWVEDRTKVVRNEAGTAIYRQGVIVDTTERKLAERALAEAREYEVEIGSQIQRSLLLGSPPDSVDKLQISAISVPSLRIDGDFYDFINHPDGCLDVLIGDVMGKGVPAALLAAGSKSAFQRVMWQLMAASVSHQTPEPEVIVNAVHRELTPQLIALDSFVTLSYVRFDPNNHKLTLVDCGNCDLLRVNKLTGETEKLIGANVPLGFSASEQYKQVQFTYNDGDTFMLHSDGVTEARSSDGDFFGEERLARVLSTSRLLNAEQITEKVRQEVMRFRESHKFADDLTCVVIKTDPNTPPQSMHAQTQIAGGTNELADMRRFMNDYYDGNARDLMDVADFDILKDSVEAAAREILQFSYKGFEHRPVWIRLYAADDGMQVRLSHIGTAPDTEAKLTQSAYKGIDSLQYGIDEMGRHYVLLQKRRNGANGKHRRPAALPTETMQELEALRD